MFSHWKSDAAFDLAKAQPVSAEAPAAAPVSPARAPAAAEMRSPPAAEPSKTEPSIINEWLTMRGDLEGDGDILVKGRVSGNVRCKMLIIDTGAFVEGGIVADDVIVRGSARGTIRTKRIRLEKTASVDCEIHHDSFAAEEGARVKGMMYSNDDIGAAKTSASPVTATAVLASNESPEAKVSSALYQMLDVARASGRSAATPAS